MIIDLSSIQSPLIRAELARHQTPLFTVLISTNMIHARDTAQGQSQVLLPTLKRGHEAIPQVIPSTIRCDTTLPPNKESPVVQSRYWIDG